MTMGPPNTGPQELPSINGERKVYFGGQELDFQRKDRAICFTECRWPEDPAREFVLKWTNSPKHFAELAHEISILRHIGDEHDDYVVSMADVLPRSEYQIGYFMDKCECDLFVEVSSYAERGQAIPRPGSIIAQISAAVARLHDLSVLHRDLKMENVFKTGPNTYKVADFGLSCIFDDPESFMDANCGSMNYAAPEVFECNYRPKPIDVWSMGIILFAMLYKSFPFKMAYRTSEDYIDYTIAEDKHLWLHKHDSRENTHLKSMVTQMLVVQPERRISTSRLNDELKANNNH